MIVEFLHERFEYRDGKLFYKIKPNKGIAAGTRAGSKRPDGYRHVRVNKKFYQEHIIIWWMHKGQKPSDLIDHENEIRDDNRIENLREANKVQNGWNAEKWATNTSGYKGVSFNKHSKKWVSYVGVNKKTKVLGYFETAEAAHEAYKLAVIKYHGIFANKRVLCA